MCLWLGQHRSPRLRALKRIAKHASESVANAAPEWVVRMMTALEKEQQSEVKRRDEQIEQLKESMQQANDAHSRTKELVQQHADTASNERSLREEAQREKEAMQAELESERSARQEAERASSAAVDECASMRDELHKLRTQERRVEAMRALRGYNTRRRLKDARMNARELRQNCSRLNARLDCSRATIRQLKAASTVQQSESHEHKGETKERSRSTKQQSKQQSPRK